MRHCHWTISLVIGETGHILWDFIVCVRARCIATLGLAGLWCACFSCSLVLVLMCFIVFLWWEALYWDMLWAICIFNPHWNKLFVFVSKEWSVVLSNLFGLVTGRAHSFELVLAWRITFLSVCIASWGLLGGQPTLGWSLLGFPLVNKDGYRKAWPLY